MSHQPVTDQKIEEMVSVLLRIGVLVSGAVVLAGGLFFLFRHGYETAAFSTFHGEPSVDRLVHEIVGGAVHLRARSLIQLGVLLLIATPILRVVLCMVGFAMERDHKFVWITAIVLSVLLFSLISGATGG